ncbi:MAG TPA: DoxX family protein [Acidimicrobiia bacterium]|jgi:putative oxidoreductase|nr:DoxX family protein [Acidimicrobiia bacterium]
MMNPRTIARTLLAGVFIIGGWELIQRPASKTEPAKEVRPMSRKLGLTTDPEQMVMLNGAVQLGGGILLMAGWMPRLAALVLGASLVPTTIASHRFWEISDPEQRRMQMMHAFKNASILGGLVMTALDHGGRPSVFWITRKAAERAGDVMSETVERVAG